MSTRPKGIEDSIVYCLFSLCDFILSPVLLRLAWNRLLLNNPSQGWIKGEGGGEGPLFLVFLKCNNRHIKLEKLSEKLSGFSYLI